MDLCFLDAYGPRSYLPPLVFSKLVSLFWFGDVICVNASVLEKYTHVQVSASGREK